MSWTGTSHFSKPNDQKLLHTTLFMNLTWKKLNESKLKDTWILLVSSRENIRYVILDQNKDRRKLYFCLLSEQQNQNIQIFTTIQVFLSWVLLLKTQNEIFQLPHKTIFPVLLLPFLSHGTFFFEPSTNQRTKVLFLRKLVSVKFFSGIL